jgi:hypothetical protein
MTSFFVSIALFSAALFYRVVRTAVSSLHDNGHKPLVLLAFS